jgi:threonine aldolase
MQAIDLRSDTVTRPTPDMLRAMTQARVGDDVLGDDPTVLELEAAFAQLTGKPAACFVPSGTMGNQACIKAHTRPGDEILAHDWSHIIQYEGGGPAALAGCMVRSLHGERGHFTPDDVEGAVRPDNVHYPRTRLVVIENTQNRGGGSVWSLIHIGRIAKKARELGLKMHLDGARLWNASIATGVPIDAYAKQFDTLTACFSKGLGAPVGSAVAGDAETIKEVRRIRKMLGGGMRQAGFLAAAALYAMKNHVARLEEDHNHAKLLAGNIADMPGLTLAPSQMEHGTETNIVFMDIEPELLNKGLDAPAFCAKMAEQGVLALPNSKTRVRLVTHLDITRDDCVHALGVIHRIAKSA